MTHECFADRSPSTFRRSETWSIAWRTAFLGGACRDRLLRAEVSLSQREAAAGHVGLAESAGSESPAPNCGGRGETWTEPCALCLGTGESLFHQALRVSVPPRVADGAACASASSRRRGVDSRELRVAIPFVRHLISLIPNPCC